MNFLKHLPAHILTFYKIYFVLILKKMTTVFVTQDDDPIENSSVSKHIVLSEEQYKVDYDALESTSDFEIENEVIDQIKQRITNQIIKTKSFLDIGCGPGRITKVLSSLFESTTVIEPNSCQLESFREHSQIKFYNTTFEDYYKKIGALASSPSVATSCTAASIDEVEKFDFILCSHVFYHIPDENWTSVIGELKPSICIFISLLNATLIDL